MKNTLIIFENSLSNLGKDEASDLLEDLSFNLVYVGVLLFEGIKSQYSLARNINRSIV